MRRRSLLHGTWALAALHAQAATPPLRVVASFSILADMAREVAGNTAEVMSLVGPDADAHVFQPTPADAQALARAELVLVNGLGFEGWIDRLIAASGYRGPVVVASAGITPRRLRGAADPHAWQSLANARRYVENIRAALVLARPVEVAAINARAADYSQRITALEERTRARFAATPAAQRRVISSHDAFGYFGDAHGIAFFAPQGWNTDSEASAADLARVIAQVRAQHVTALFVENMTDPRLMQGVAREARVALGGKLYSDALSAPGTAADTYLKMFAHNAEVIAAAMQAGAAGLAAR